MKVAILINQTPGSAFCRVFHHTELRTRWEGDLGCPAGASDTEVLNHVFRIFNADRPAGYTGPSLSVADVVTLEGDRSYEVLPCGFGLLPVVASGEKYIVELPEPSLNEIKGWRAAEHEANRDSTIEAFYRSRNMCRRCRGKNHLAGHPPNSCKVCGGTGEYPSTQEERVLQGLRNVASSLKQSTGP